MDFNIYGAVIFGSFSGTSGVYYPDTEEEADESDDVQIDENSSETDEFEEVLDQEYDEDVCDFDSITLFFINKLSYQTLFTVPVIPAEEGGSSSQQTVITLPELENQMDIACDLELDFDISYFNAEDLYGSDWVEFDSIEYSHVIVHDSVTSITSLTKSKFVNASVTARLLDPTT